MNETYEEMMKEFADSPIEEVPFKSRVLLKSGDAVLFQGKNAEGERLKFFWVLKGGKLVRWSHRISDCLPYANS